MEDHRDAYFFWKELGVRGASCLHVDAHLDMAQYQAPLNPDVQQPEINCANYLLKAVEEGIVSEVVWVVPPHMFANHKSLLDWSHHELPAWLPLRLDEHNSLVEKDGRVQGRLRGVPLTICDSAHLPAMDSNWLLDLDIDYFLGELDDVWETPFALHDRLPEGSSFQAVTVAISVFGGYTPVALRYLGDLSALVFGGQPVEAQEWWQHYQGLESLNDCHPSLQAAALVGRARGAGSDHTGPNWERAAQLDPRYLIEPFDVASFYWHRKQFARCQQWLGRCQGPQVDYLRGFIAFERKEYSKAIGHWQTLVGEIESEADPVSLRHMLTLLGKAQAKANRLEDANGSLKRAVSLGPAPSDLLRELAQVQRRSGDLTQAQNTFRKAIRMDAQELGNLEARLELAELYMQTGQKERAGGICQDLNQLELPGNLAIRNERLRVKLSLQTGLVRK